MNKYYYYYRCSYEVYDELFNLKGFRSLRLVSKSSLMRPDIHLNFEQNLKEFLENIFTEIKQLNEEDENAVFKFPVGTIIRLVSLEQIWIDEELNTDYMQVDFNM